MRTGKWDARIQRANDLASTHPFASQALRFYERLARFQQSFYAEIEAECGIGNEKRLSGTLRGECVFFVLLSLFSGFVSVFAVIAYPPLTHARQSWVILVACLICVLAVVICVWITTLT